jgi:hypothetical protein
LLGQLLAAPEGFRSHIDLSVVSSFKRDNVNVYVVFKEGSSCPSHTGMG